MSISPLQLARTPNLLSSQLSTSQLNTTQQLLLQVEQQISTGKKFAQPSDDPGDAAITMQLQRTINQSQTYLSNLASAQSQLGQVDNALGTLTPLIQQAQNIASADVNTTVTPAQRAADANVIDSIYNQALSIANTQYNGQYLFAGSRNGQPPYVSSGGGVQFVGTSNTLKTAVNDQTSLAFQADGPAVFGGTSSQVTGTIDLTPNLETDTRISDLRGATGQGVQLGSIQISDGTNTAIVDLSKADNIGDVVNAINNAGVGTITAAITGQGLTLTAGPADNISVTDVGGDATADELGIAQPAGAGAGISLVGTSVAANVTQFTQLSDLKAGAGIDTTGITITNGTQSANISFAGAQTVGDLLNAINGSGTSVQAKINASGTGIDIVNPTQGLQMTVSENGGTTAADLGVQSFNTQTKLSDLNGGKGVNIAATGNDFTVTTSDGNSFNVSLAGSQTVADVINNINVFSGGTVTAAFSPTTNGITLTDTTGGAGNFTVAPVNGSTAAADLGLTQNTAVANTITGTDVNPISASGLFSNLAKLRQALLNNDQQGITNAAGGLQTDYQNAVSIRGAVGAQVQGMQSRQDQITTQNTATQSLMSQLSDTDFTAAITKFQTLQTSLQATLQVTAKTLNLSLINFLS